MAIYKVLVGGNGRIGFALRIEARSDSEQSSPHKRTIMILAGKLFELCLRLAEFVLGEKRSGGHVQSTGPRAGTGVTSGHFQVRRSEFRSRRRAAHLHSRHV